MPSKGYKQFLRLQNKLRILKSGPVFFDLFMAQIADAKQEIHAQFYIFKLDTIGVKVLTALQQAAQKGVKVYLLLDDFGSKRFPKHILETCHDLKMEIKWFSPVQFPFGLGRRLHHKIVVIDRKWAFCGGMNVSDPYAGSGQFIDHVWLDFVMITEGMVVNDLLKVCRKYWGGLRFNRQKKEQLNPSINHAQLNQSAGVLQNNWMARKKYIAAYYFSELRKSTTEIIIINSYFLPSLLYRRMLIKAAKRGVQVKIILSGKSDVLLMQQAIRFIYSELLASGVQLYEWNQSVLHAKVALFDESSFTIGSYNLNHLSQFSSVETNLVSTDFNAYQDLKSIIDIELLPYCGRISIEQLQQKRNRITHLIQYLSFTLVVALFRLYQRLIYNKNNS